MAEINIDLKDLLKAAESQVSSLEAAGQHIQAAGPAFGMDALFGGGGEHIAYAQERLLKAREALASGNIAPDMRPFFELNVREAEAYLRFCGGDPDQLNEKEA